MRYEDELWHMSHQPDKHEMLSRWSKADIIILGIQHQKVSFGVDTLRGWQLIQGCRLFNERGGRLPC